MNKTVTEAEAKSSLSDLLSRVVHQHERIIVSKDGKPIGALISAADLKQLEELEKQQTLARIAEIKARTKEYIPYEQFLREYEEKWGVKLDDVDADE